MPKSIPNPQNLAQILKMPRWTPADAAEVVAAWRRSGQSQRTFCEQHGIDGQRLARWAKASSPTPSFAEVVVVDSSSASASASPNSPIVIELGPARVIVDHDVDDAHLARVLRVVGSTC